LGRDTYIFSTDLLTVSTASGGIGLS